MRGSPWNPSTMRICSFLNAIGWRQQSPVSTKHSNQKKGAHRKRAHRSMHRVLASASYLGIDTVIDEAALLLPLERSPERGNAVKPLQQQRMTNMMQISNVTSFIPLSRRESIAVLTFNAHETITNRTLLPF